MSLPREMEATAVAELTKKQYDILETLRAKRGAQLVGRRPNSAFGFAYVLLTPSKLNEEDHETTAVAESDLRRLLGEKRLDAAYDTPSDTLHYRLNARGETALAAFNIAQSQRGKKKGRSKPGREG